MTGIPLCLVWGAAVAVVLVIAATAWAVHLIQTRTADAYDVFDEEPPC